MAAMRNKRNKLGKHQLHSELIIIIFNTDMIEASHNELRNYFAYWQYDQEKMHLNLWNGGWYPKVLELIQQNSFNLQSIRLLNVERGDFRNEDLKAISKLNLCKLESLNIGYTRVNGQGLAHLGDCNTFARIIYLNLVGIKMNGMGAKILIKVDFPILQRLWVDRSGLGNEGVRHLAKSDWKNLNELIMRQNHIQFDGYVELCNSYWPKLKHLLLTSNQIIIPAILHLTSLKSKALKQNFFKKHNPVEKPKILIIKRIFRTKFDKKNIFY